MALTERLEEIQRDQNLIDELLAVGNVTIAKVHMRRLNKKINEYKRAKAAKELQRKIYGC